jgi:hypothetical protein
MLLQLVPLTGADRARWGRRVTFLLFFFFFDEGPSHHSQGFLCNPKEDDDEQFFLPIFTINGAPVE